MLSNSEEGYIRNMIAKGEPKQKTVFTVMFTRVANHPRHESSIRLEDVHEWMDEIVADYNHLLFKG